MNKIPPILNNIFNFFCENELDNKKSYDMYLNAAKEFISLEKLQEEQEEIKIPSFYNSSVYTFFEKKVDKKKDAFNFISALVDFQNIVVDLINKKDLNKKYWVVTDKDVTEHVANKPLEAYKYKSHNELDIKTTRIKVIL
ncbi:MAG: hypothetical protein QG630_497 [Patescibacteria group bacterium]|nr:hypothetical protein [Patescibacteria group bacterium]